MKNGFIEDVYDSLCGYLAEGYIVPGVESIFEPGMYCSDKYSNMLDAYERLLHRLGLQDEDRDIEMIVNSLLDISREIGRHMYCFGAKFGERP